MHTVFHAAALAAISCLAPALRAQRIYVDAAALPGGDGTTWTTAYVTLQPALARAASGAEIFVAQGSYRGGFVVPAGVALRGGFIAGATSAAQAQPFVLSTVLDGGGSERVLVLGQAVVLDGFVVRNGNAPAPGGGGALIDGTDPQVTRCVFMQNRNAGGRGAALCAINGANPRVSDSLFVGNANTGHTIDVDLGAGGTYDHLTVADNGHNGMHMQGGVRCAVSNSLFVRNAGRGICDVTSGPVNQPTLVHNLFFQNAVSLMHYRGTELHTIDAVNALAYARGNLAADPRFVGSGDYRVLADSAAIDAGTGAFGVARDPFGAARMLDGNLDGAAVTDIGAHEFHRAALSLRGGAAGGMLECVLDGAGGVTGALALGVPGGAVALPPLGVVYGTPLLVLPLGALPGRLALPVPVGARGALQLQGIAWSGNAGNFGNAIELRVQ